MIARHKPHRRYREKLDMIWDLGSERRLDLGTSSVPRMMGVLNVTPDSFSDGGRHNAPPQAVAEGLAMAEQGAAIIDVGGESTRPGAERIGAAEQIDRTRNVIRQLAQALRERDLDTAISIDTTLAEVAEAALDAGAHVVNDISAGREDPDILTLCARRGCGLILMHMQGEPGTMQANPHYDDVVAEVGTFLRDRAAAAQQAGIQPQHILLDPGFGFGKRLEDNLALLHALPHWCTRDELGFPLMVGLSRKRMIAMLSPETTSHAADRLGGTIALTTLAVCAGARLIRVHDVGANRQAGEITHEFRIFEDR